jgi:hypothetical protein
LKAYKHPPADVATVMAAVMTVLGKKTAWASVVKELSEVSKFVKSIIEFNAETINQATLKKIEKYTKMDNFKPEHMMKISSAGASLCAWVRSVEDYCKAL